MCPMLRCRTRLIPAVLTLLLIAPAAAHAQQPAAPPAATVEAQLRKAIREYDDAVRRADVAAIERSYAPEYFFVNPRGERLTRAERIANFRTGRTVLDTLAHAPQEERIVPYGNVVVYSALLTLGGRYSGQAEQGRHRALVVWVNRDGRWQQVASQLTRIATP